MQTISNKQIIEKTTTNIYMNAHIRTRVPTDLHTQTLRFLSAIIIITKSYLSSVLFCCYNTAVHSINVQKTTSFSHIIIGPICHSE